MLSSFEAGDEDRKVDEVLEQTFPASDPPPGPTAIL
jgi:hypothetical protein